ncbi:uncharacterized protein LOC105209231 [Zeugodacus cucurbitae]|uniref:uncharacterized protein LOC105209231 n=1 Tax=Zeugodacus cucurbitae TaxID=28588 RepID=UPI0023D94DD3|nr:uncharacterized protein LOC105209231 [Zeugodacus cucurbitae]
MKKFKKKIHRKYEDFYDANDLRDPDTFPNINLTINDFDARGGVVNPRAPCLVTTIDPSYVKDARTQRLARKFRMKTDILLLREITRKKFMIFSTQQMYLDKEREKKQQDDEYQGLLDFFEYTENSLQAVEANAYKDMRASLEKCQELQKCTLADELKAVKEDHRRALVEAHDVYQRFLYLLKLIGYFDEIDDEAVGAEGSRLILPKKIAELKAQNESETGMQQIEVVRNYMDAVVRPYLAKRNHLKADVWLKGFELTRSKLTNYYKRYTNLALLNHIVALVYEKFQKTQARCKIPPMLKDANFMKKRVATLRLQAEQTLVEYENKQSKDKLTLKLNAIVPVILKSLQRSAMRTNEPQKAHGKLNGIENTEAVENQSVKSFQSRPESALSSCRDEPDTTLAKIELIQAHLLWLLNELDDMPPELCKEVEKRVRRRFKLSKEKSRRALVEQTRLQNWMAHFKKHELQRQIDTAICVRRKVVHEKN